MSDANREAAIERAEEHVYDIIGLFDHDEKRDRYRDPAKTDPQRSNKIMSQDFRDPGGRHANSGASHASGLAFDRVR